jgi:hypothetical protein
MPEPFDKINLMIAQNFIFTHPKPSQKSKPICQPTNQSIT